MLLLKRLAGLSRMAQQTSPCLCQVSRAELALASWPWDQKAPFEARLFVFAEVPLLVQLSHGGLPAASVTELWQRKGCMPC